MDKIKGYHLIKVKYLGPTNKQPSRVKLISYRGNWNITWPFINKNGYGVIDESIAFLKLNGFKVFGYTTLSNREDGIIVDRIDLRRTEYKCMRYAGYDDVWECVHTDTNRDEAEINLRAYRADGHCMKLECIPQPIIMLDRSNYGD